MGSRECSSLLKISPTPHLVRDVCLFDEGLDAGLEGEEAEVNVDSFLHPGFLLHESRLTEVHLGDFGLENLPRDPAHQHICMLNRHLDMGTDLLRAFEIGHLCIYPCRWINGNEPALSLRDRQSTCDSSLRRQFPCPPARGRGGEEHAHAMTSRSSPSPPCVFGILSLGFGGLEILIKREAPRPSNIEGSDPSELRAEG
jgi:hypothetical protein